MLFGLFFGPLGWIIVALLPTMSVPRPGSSSQTQTLSEALRERKT